MKLIRVLIVVLFILVLAGVGGYFYQIKNNDLPIVFYDQENTSSEIKPFKELKVREIRWSKDKGWQYSNGLFYFDIVGKNYDVIYPDGSFFINYHKQNNTRIIVYDNKNNKLTDFNYLRIYYKGGSILQSGGLDVTVRELMKTHDLLVFKIDK